MLIIEAVWSRLHQPRTVNALQLVSYAIAFIFGIALVFLRPEGVTTTIGILSTLFLGVALIAGASTASASLYAGSWWLERVGNLVIVGGYIALSAVILLSENLSEFMKFSVMLSIIDATAALLRRYYAIRWAYLDPMR